MLPLQRDDGKGSSPLLKLIASPACKGCSNVMLCKATRPPAPSLPGCFSLSVFLPLTLSISISLPPLSFSLSTPLTQLLPQPVSSATSGIHSKKHTLLGSAPRLRSHREGGSNRRWVREEERAGDPERICSDRHAA